MPWNEKCAEPAHAACALAKVFGTDGLGSIFDHGNSVLLADRQQPFHVAEIAIEMHGENGFCLRRDRSLGQIRVDAPAIGTDVNEDRLGAEMNDRRRRGDPVGVGEDDLVAGTDAQRRHSHMQRAGAARRGDRMRYAEMILESGFEADDVIVAAFAPAVGGGIGRVARLELGDRGLGIKNARSRVAVSLHRHNDIPEKDGGNVLSRSEMILSAMGQSIASLGSSNRKPTAAPGT